MDIHSVKYIENGYFLVDYGNTKVMQDLMGIKMTVPGDESIKKIAMFLRTLKVERLQNVEEFDDLKYRDTMVVEMPKKEISGIDDCVFGDY
jgi:hypothetical protein